MEDNILKFNCEECKKEIEESDKHILQNLNNKKVCSNCYNEIVYVRQEYPI